MSKDFSTGTEQCWICALLLLSCLVQAVISDYNLTTMEVGPGEQSVRTLNIRENMIKLTWINREQYTEPAWEFYLNGKRLEDIKPSSWEIVRTSSSLQVHTNNQVNFEMYMRDENILTVEAITRQNLSTYTRLVFSQRLKLEVELSITCDPVTQGEFCEECTGLSMRIDQNGNVCHKLPLDNNTNQFIEQILLPLVIGCILFITVVSVISFICARVYRAKRKKKVDSTDEQEGNEVLNIINGTSKADMRKGSQMGPIKSVQSIFRRTSRLSQKDNTDVKQDLAKSDTERIPEEGKETSPGPADDILIHRLIVDKAASSEEVHLHKPSNHTNPILERVLGMKRAKVKDQEKLGQLENKEDTTTKDVPRRASDEAKVRILDDYDTVYTESKRVSIKQDENNKGRRQSSGGLPGQVNDKADTNLRDEYDAYATIGDDKRYSKAPDNGESTPANQKSGDNDGESQTEMGRVGDLKKSVSELEGENNEYARVAKRHTTPLKAMSSKTYYSEYPQAPAIPPKLSNASLGETVYETNTKRSSAAERKESRKKLRNQTGSPLTLIDPKVIPTKSLSKKIPSKLVFSESPTKIHPNMSLKKTMEAETPSDAVAEYSTKETEPQVDTVKDDHDTDKSKGSTAETASTKDGNQETKKKGGMWKAIFAKYT